MRILLLPLVILYRLHFATVFFLVLTVLYPVFWLLLLREKNYLRVWRLKVITSRIILFLDFIYLKREIRTKKLKGPFVICANHTSYLDIILFYPILPKTRFLFMGKSELLRWPIINIFFKKIDIAVSREKRHSAFRSITRAKKEIGNGWSIVIYPEGGIPVDAPRMQHFKNGAFKMAIDLQVPVLPITILDNWKLFGTDPVLTGRARPGMAKVIIHEPIETKGLQKKDLVSLRTRVFDVINNPLKERYKSLLENS